ncbi:MAG: 2Fe-2S iron-sulfur cluster-binding protein [Candidatus Bathyarchaeales archaeon]
MSSRISKFYVCRRILERFVECGFCLESFECPGVGKPSIERFETACVDCGVCLLACPYEAVEHIMDIIPRKHVKIVVDGQEFLVSERVTIKKALEMLGLEFRKFLGETKIFAPCETGGCFACALLVNGKVKPACVTPVSDGMEISLDLPKDYVPLRRVSGF